MKVKWQYLQLQDQCSCAALHPLLRLHLGGYGHDCSGMQRCHHLVVQDPVQAGCGDTFCRGCIQEYIDSAAAEGAAQCPTCSRPLTISLQQVHTHRISTLQSAVQSADGVSRSAKVEVQDLGSPGSC
jgi:hypothetical protein